ncbi:hypothetical protein A7U60_g930 [Sanghuangporus baumii]|uniref:DUF7587 domain-containing protein n=1 Tax=Sanghuangporus baumii TaxID=108892 RepID=A0A9Q5N9T3_SANBA|nr:hypothetical protein A7U60_g930 [Sanghuangporus baumii]
MSRRLSAPSAGPRHFWNIPHSRKKYDSVVDLAPYNPLLFRISHRNSGSYYFEGEGVVANEHFSVDVGTGERRLDSTVEELCTRLLGRAPISADKLVEHVLYNKTQCTNFVSTTFSFTWSLFFAKMNSSNWNEEDVELLVIDTCAVAHRAWVAHEQLSRICPEWWNNAKHRKINNAAYSSQEVIVLDCIPEFAIISRVPWAYLKTKFPSWFYPRPSYAGSNEIIPIPNDGQSQRYVRWQKTAQEQLQQVSRRRRGIVARKEAVAFVFAVFAPQNITETGVLLLNGLKTRQEFESIAKHAARSLLQWSRASSSPSVDAKDENELPELIRDAMSNQMRGTQTGHGSIKDVSKMPGQSSSAGPTAGELFRAPDNMN